MKTIIRKKDNLNKTWKWKVVYIDPIMSTPGCEVYEVISVHNTKEEATKAATSN